MARTSTKTKTSDDLSQLLPQDTQAEEAVLGAILVNPVSLTKIVELLKPDFFYKTAHKHIYEAMLFLFNNNERIDIVTVSDVLNMNGKLETVGGRAFINDLSYRTITTANIEYYAKIVVEKAVKRALINAGSEIITTGYEPTPITESLEKAERLIFDIASERTKNDLVHVKDLVLQSYDKIEFRYNHRGELLGVPSGFYELDESTNGFQKSDLIILAARPSMGKTAFALNIAQNAAIRSKKPIAIFSLEMSKEQLVQRMLCSEAEVDTQRLRSGNMGTQDWDKLAAALNEFMEAPIYIDDTGGMSLTDLRAKCRRLAMMEKDLGLIIIDYLQLMEGTGKDEQRIQQISAISRGLKTLARELNVPIIALSQLSRAVEARNDKRPMLSDLRESGAIEQDADIVMFIYRDEYYKKDSEEEDKDIPRATTKGEAEIIIAKQRNGPVGTIKLLYQANITKFKNPANTDKF